MRVKNVNSRKTKKKHKKTIRQKVFYSLLSLIFAFIFMVIPREIPVLDKKGDEYFNTAIKETLAVYAVTRITNAFVSVVKDTQVTITPMGVGVTVSIGQFLDPLDDATERLSGILTISIAIIGLMKISKEVLSIISYNIISFLLLLITFIVWIDYFQKITRVLLILVVTILTLRFALPLCGTINNQLYESFFKPKVKNTLKTFKGIKEIYNTNKSKSILNVETNFSLDNQEETSFWGGIKNKIETLKRSSKMVKEKALVVKEIARYMWDNKEDFIKAIVNLIILEVSIIFIQAVVLPFFVLWILLKLLNSIFDYTPERVKL